MTTLSLNYPYTTKDRTKPYLAKLEKGPVKNYKGNRNWTYRSQRFSSEIVFTKGCTADIRARDATEVVIIAEKAAIRWFRRTT